MTQSRRMSLVEAVTNVIVGYALAVGMQIVVFPVFGIHIALGDQLSIGLAFTVLCGAPHNTVYAERMIMRSLWRPSTAKN